jgi:hypothetical protein
VQATGIVETLNVLEQIASGLVAGGVDPVMDRSVLRVWKKLSIGALSQQSPLRLMEGVIPDAARAWR